MFLRHRLLVVLLAGAVLLPGGARALDGPHAGVVSADPADGTPQILDGKVTAILPLGDRIYVGGTFTQVQEAGTGIPVLSRRGLFVFDRVTGVVDPHFVADFDVDPNGDADRAVEALAPGPDDRSIFVGGTFGALNGTPTGTTLVKLDAATGARDSGYPVNVGAGVKDLAVHDSRLFLAGKFSVVSGEPRGGLAAVDTGTGAVDPDVTIAFTDPRSGTVPRVETIAVSADGRSLVAGGNFMSAGGQRRPQIAMVDVGARPARLADWHTDGYDATCSEAGFDTHMRDIGMAPDGSWFVVVTSGGYNKTALCDAAARWETSARGSGLQPTWWDKSGGDSFTAVAVTGAAVYVSGHVRWLNNNYPPNGTSAAATPGPGAVPREGIAALDPRNGLPLSWNPGRARGEGAWALVPTPDGLWVGSDTDRIGGEHHAKLAFFPLAGGKPVARDDNAPLPGDLWTIGTDGALTRRSFDGSAVGAATPAGGGPDWAEVRGAFTAGGKLYTGHADGRFTVQAVGPGGPYGPVSDVDLHGLNAADPPLFPVGRMTGMFYDAGRLYHTVSGDSRLFVRWFSPDSDVVGNDVTVVAGAPDSVDFNGVAGMTMASGRLTYAKNGALHTVAFHDGRPHPPTDAFVANSTGTDWTSRGMFILAPK